MKARAAHSNEKPHSPHWPLAALLFAFVFALAMNSVHEPSAWIHVKTGARILSEGVLPRTDPFSYGVVRAPWTTHSWLADVLFAKLDALGGPGLLAAVKSVAIAVGFALLLPVSHGNPVLAAAVLSVGACAAWAGMGEAPAAFDFLFFALFLRLLRPRHRFHWSDLAAVAGLTALWSNLHGASATIALWLVSLKVFKTTLRTVARERFGYWMMLAVTGLFFSWNPHGYGILAYAFSDAAAGAGAWQLPLASLYGAFMLAGVVSCGLTLQQEFVATLAAANVMALSLVLPGLRPLAVMAACPVITLALGHVLPPRSDTGPRVLRWCAGAAALFAVYHHEIARALAPTGGYSVPALTGAAHFLSTAGVRGRMFNEPALGTELIGLTERPVFSDARLDLYPATFRREAEDWPHLFKSLDTVYRFDYAVVRNRRAQAPARVIDEDPEWRLAYADDRALVYLKKSGVNGWLVPQSSFRLVAPNRLWPDGLDAVLSRPRQAPQVLEEIDRWSLQAPDSVQALVWKAYVLDRLKMADKADRLLDLVLGRPALDWDPELIAGTAFVLQARGHDDQAKLLYRRAARSARRLGDEALEAEISARLERLKPPTGTGKIDSLGR